MPQFMITNVCKHYLRTPAFLMFLALALVALPFLPAFARVAAHTARVKGSNRSIKGRRSLTRLSESVSVLAAGRGKPAINLSDGHQVLTSYAGPDELQQAVSQNQAEPLSLATADFDEDGVPDLVSGYGYQGRGIVSLLRGNVDSIYPNAPEAQQRRRTGNFTDAPFLSPAILFSVPAAVDFIGAGDFDGDSHWDLVTGSRGDVALYLLAGDGHGGFSPRRTVALPGELTAFITGEINRADGLADLVVGVSAKDGACVLVFEGPDGALNIKPEELPMPAAVSALVLGQLDNGYEMDLAVGAGERLEVVHGRDRKLSLPSEQQQKVLPAQIETHALSAWIKSLVIGDFTPGQRQSLAVLTGDGQISVVGSSALSPSGGTPTSRRSRWHERSVATGAGLQALQLVRAKASSLPGDDLLIIEANNQLRLVAGAGQDAVTQTTTLDTASQPIALLPMRLNVDALTDLVVLQKGQSAPGFIVTATAQTFVVNSTADANDGACTATPNGCTFREAINASNNNFGADTINFNIPGSNFTITLVQSLQSLNETVTIDGTTQPGFQGAPIIELNGNNGNFAGLGTNSVNCLIRGLVINRFQGAPILGLSSGEVIEGNYLGVNVAGNAALTNGQFGILKGQSNGTTNIIVGGTTTAARNVISGFTNAALFIGGPGTSGVVIQGNFIGTDSTGQTVLSNGGTGINLFRATNSTIGGTTPQTRNVFGGWTKGVAVGDSSTGILVQGNYIGTNVTGTIALPNDTGVGLVDSSNNTVGGTLSSARNLISGNRFTGLFINPFISSNASGNLIQGNFIGTNVAGTGALPNGDDGVSFSGSNGNTVGGTAAGAMNLISGNVRTGVTIGASTDNQVLGNLIGTDVTGTFAIPNGQRGIFVKFSDRNKIGGTTAAARNVISGNGDAGLRIYGGVGGPGSTPVGSSDNVVQGNFIGTDVTGTQKLANGTDGVQVTIQTGSANNIIGGATPAMRNIISGNGGNGVAIGIRLNDPTAPGSGGIGITIQNNYIGTDVSGNNCLGNSQDGVFVDADSTTNTISENLIACNGRNGVFIPQNSNPAVRIFLDDNFVYKNASLGIDLGVAGITANDPLDGDSGANLQQNFPTLTSFGPSMAGGKENSRKKQFDRPESPASTDATIMVASQLNSAPNTTFTIHWYFSNDSQCVTNQQTSRALAFGRIPGVATDGNGNASFSFALDFPAGMTSGVINTTATDPNGNTSEFSPCLAVMAPTPAVQFNAGAYSVGEGDLYATIIATRAGDTTGASSVDFAASDGSATQNQDYVVTSGTLNFAAGETSKSFLVLIVDDAFVEGSQGLNLTLSNPTGASLAAPSTATLTITDNDSAGSTSPAAKRFGAMLDGGQETPANNSAAKGTGYVLLNGGETSALVGVQFQNLGSAEISAHIHGAAPAGVSAPILFTLAPPVVNPIVNMSITPTAQQVTDLKADLHYFNVHSNNFPNGEIRGQLRWNPSLEESFFVRQQYLDFLSRDGDPGGFGFWVNQVGSCQADAQCLHDRTITTSNAFFFEPEFQQTAGYVFRAYRAAFGNNQPFPNPDGSNATEANKLIDYAAFVADRARVVGGADLALAQQAFASQFVLRTAFTTKYAGATTGAQFVDAILENIQSADGANLTAQRQALIDQYTSAGGGNGGRAVVLYRLADDNAQSPINTQAFINAEYNRQFALTLFFGYLRRNPDIGGFLFWQSQINLAPVRDVPKQNALVCSFITAAEYQLRFGPNAPRSNAECPQ